MTEESAAALSLDFAEGFSNKPLSREQSILVSQRLLRLKILATESMTTYRPLHWHLQNIETMRKCLANLKADLIMEENQLQLEIGDSK